MIFRALRKSVRGGRQGTAVLHFRQASDAAGIARRLEPGTCSHHRLVPLPVNPDGPVSLLVPVGPGKLELPPVPEVPLLPLVPLSLLRRRHSSSVMVPGIVLLVPVPDVPVPLVVPDPLVVSVDVELSLPVVPEPLMPVPVVPEDPLPPTPLPDVVDSVRPLDVPDVVPPVVSVVPVVPVVSDVPDVPDVPLVEPVVPEVPDASVAPLAPVPSVPDALLVPYVPPDPLVLIPLVPVPLVPPVVAPEIPVPIVEPPPALPPDTVPVPVDVPVAAGLSALMLPLPIVRSGVDDEVELLCENVAVLAPSKEMNTAIGSFFMLPPNKVTG